MTQKDNNAKLNILHLEDDPNDAELVKAHLESEEIYCGIVRVDNKKDFITSIKQKNFDLILADYSLPSFDGLSALTLSKEMCPDIPFILLSGMLGEEVAIESMKAGATDYVIKQRLNRLGPSIKRALRETEDRKQRRIAEEALMESEGKYRNLVDNLDIGVILISPGKEIITYNHQVLKWFPSIDNDKIKKFKCYQTLNIPPENAECPACPVSQSFSDGQRHESMREINTSDALQIFRIITLPVRDSKENVTNVIEIMEDVTEKTTIETEMKKLEERLQQSRKMEAIGTLAGGIAHDLNNILMPIMAYTEMVITDLPENSPHVFHLKEVYKASERARDLIKQILAFSRQKHDERKPVIVSKIIDESFKLLRPSIPSTIEIRREIEAESDMIFADPTQIHQVIMNLCANASYAMREQGGTLEVGLKTEYIDSKNVKKFSNLAPGYYLKLTVKDSGTGMSDEIKKRIFEPYFTTKSPGEGTGMGLAVIHGIVQSLNGDIIVETRPGEGSAFSVYLPKIKDQIESAAKKFDEIPGGSEHILIVDDEKINTEAMCFALEKLGYTVTAVTSSKECLEIFTGNPDAYDLIITDMTMPEFTGKELAKRMLAIRRDVPIIICTGYSDFIDKKIAKEMGIKEFIMKPFVIHEVAGVIRKVLQNN